MLGGSLVPRRFGQIEILRFENRLDRGISWAPSIFDTDQVQLIHFGRT
jgi:hypothetical protein